MNLQCRLNGAIINNVMWFLVMFFPLNYENKRYPSSPRVIDLKRNDPYLRFKNLPRHMLPK